MRKGCPLWTTRAPSKSRPQSTKGGRRSTNLAVVEVVVHFTEDDQLILGLFVVAALDRLFGGVNLRLDLMKKKRRYGCG